jgi:hypothetical protein
MINLTQDFSPHHRCLIFWRMRMMLKKEYISNREYLLYIMAGLLLAALLGLLRSMW